MVEEVLVIAGEVAVADEKVNPAKLDVPPGDVILTDPVLPFSMIAVI